jgi:hypothetical protein
MKALYVALVSLGTSVPGCTGTDGSRDKESQPVLTGPAQLDPAPVPPPDHPAYTSGFIDRVAVVYQNGEEHAENAELHVLPSGEMLLAFRGGGTGQPETPEARIRVFHFDPETYAGTLRDEVQMPPLAPPRGIRDPKLFTWNHSLRLGAISREAGFPIRDLLSNTRTVLARSRDDGRSFTTPAFMRFYNTGDATWGLWRYVVRAFQSPPGWHHRTLYATGYNDGDREAAYFFSPDGGRSFIKLGSLVDAPADVPSEAELFFLGPNQRTAVSLVRLDNQGLLSDGQTAICVKRVGLFAMMLWGDFACTRRIEQRLDGPSQIIEEGGRTFVAARKHLPCTRKRTALYEIRGDLADPEAPVSLCEIAELPSNGDTAYVAIAPIPNRPREYVAAWYSTPLGLDLPWLPAQLAPSWILAARLDFRKYDPAICTPPPPDPVCPPPPVPAAMPRDVEGTFLLALAPSFFPSLPAFFSVTATTGAGAITLSLQPLDQQAFLAGETVAVGEPFQGTSALAPDGSFWIDFGSPRVPHAIYPLGGGNGAGLIHYVLDRFQLRGATTSAETFCGGAEGNVVVSSDTPGLIPPNTFFRLDGSSFGATRGAVITGCAQAPAR